MRTDILRTYKTLHTWTGIISGLALFIAFYAGALTIFKDPISRWASAPDKVQSEVALSEAPLLITETLKIYPEATKDLRLQLDSNNPAQGKLVFSLPDDEADDHNLLAYHHYSVTRETNGSVMVQEAYPTQLAEFIDVLHRVIGLPFDTDANRWIMGVVALIYSIALVSGLIIFLPTLVKNLFALRLNKKPRRKWLDAHNVVGIASLPFHLVIVITSVVFAYHDGFYTIQDKMIHDGNLKQIMQTGRPAPNTEQPINPEKMLPASELIAKAQALSPSFKPEMLQYIRVNSPFAVVRVWGHDETAVSPRAWGGFVPINPYTAEVQTLEYMPGKQGTASTTLSSFFALHFATYGGTPVQWMYFILGLSGAWLFYNGNLLWLENRRKVQLSQGTLPTQRRDTQWLASLTVGICLGAISGISLTIAAGKWLHGSMSDLTSMHQIIYYAIFFSAIAWAFIRGAAKASVDLLIVAAIATFAIPLTTVTAWVIPEMGLWGHTRIDTLSVDITAFIGGLAFLWMAQLTYKRVYLGSQDSVWSAQKTGRLTEEKVKVPSDSVTNKA